MTRCIFAWLVIIALSTVAAAADDWTVLEASDKAPPSKLLYRYLQEEAQEHFDARRKEVAALVTPDDVKRRQTELRKRFIEALGGFPEKTPLNGRVVGQERRDGYRIEKVVYESRPRHHITAVLYLPSGEAPYPGVIVPCGHSANGKAAEPYQRACILLAKNGVAALCYDPIGQGERMQLLNAEGKPAITGSTSEHTMVGVGALLVGKSTATYRIWDGIRSLDYLASRKEIDPARLGCTGNSGGGTLTSYLMALDERIVAAAPSCYLTTLERLFATIGPQDAEQNITGQVAFGMDHADYLTLRAPRPTLMCVGTQDYFDIDGAWTSFREAKRVYGILGFGERVDLFEFNDKHGFSLPRRQAAMRWMRHWLLDVNDAPTESDFPVAKDPDMLCTSTGQVLSEFKGRSAFDLNAEEAAALATRRTSGPPEVATLRRLLAISDRIEPAAKELKAKSEAKDHRLTKLIYQPSEGIPLPAILLEPMTAAADKPLVIYVHEAGKAADAGENGPISQLVKQGRSVLALDVRGWGETAPGKQNADRPGAFGVDSKEFFLSLHLNRPLLGQRVSDVLAVIGAVTTEGQTAVELMGIGAAGPIVLHAAALDPRVSAVMTQRSIASWTSVAQTPLTVNQLCNAVPNVLAHYDLPDLVAAIRPRTCNLVAPVDPAGRAIAGK